MSQLESSSIAFELFDWQTTSFLTDRSQLSTYLKNFLWIDGQDELSCFSQSLKLYIETEHWPECLKSQTVIGHDNASFFS